MFPAAPVTGAHVKTAQPMPTMTAQKTTQPQAPETARASAGEAAAANIKTESARAVQAPEQTPVAPRLRDQETAERTERSEDRDNPTGPEPAFEETLLERDARVALDPPEFPVDAAPEVAPDEAPDDTEQDLAAADVEIDPPPSPAEKAEAGFNETRTLASIPDPATVDVRT